MSSPAGVTPKLKTKLVAASPVAEATHSNGVIVKVGDAEISIGTFIAPFAGVGVVTAPGAVTY